MDITPPELRTTLVSDAAADSVADEDFYSTDEGNNMAADRRQERIPTGFSLVIDDVDGDLDSSTSECSGECSRMEEVSQQDMPHDDASPAEKEKSDARIQQIKGEAEIRKNQFAQLLEEHAQIMQRLKQMEEGPSVLRGPEMGPTEV